MNNTVPPGYKQTEVGVIPEEWSVKCFGETCWVNQGLQIARQNRKKHPSVKSKIYITIVFLYVGKEADYFDDYTSSVCCGNDDVLMTRTGNTGIVVTNVNGVFHNNFFKINFDKQLVDKDFLVYSLTSPSMQKTILTKAGTSTIPDLNHNDFYSINIPLPTLPEQHAIATALSDLDALIASLDKLIAKKRDMKQAAMQELLTGKRRLPGFDIVGAYGNTPNSLGACTTVKSGECHSPLPYVPHGWEVKRLGDLFSFSGGYSASRDQLSAEGHCYLHYGDIHGATKTFVDTRADYQTIPKLDIPLKRISSKSLLKDGDVVFVDASEDDEGTSRHVVVVNKDDLPFISGLHTIVAKSKTDELAHAYRRYCFQTAAIRQQFLFYAVGTKVAGISKSNISKLTLLVPSIPEQTAIAAILSDMDTEIAALEQKRDKTRQLKQGMMQELLTGRIRLV